MGKKINLTAKIDRDLHKKLKIKLLKDDTTYKDWVLKQIKEYVKEE